MRRRPGAAPRRYPERLRWASAPDCRRVLIESIGKILPWRSLVEQRSCTTGPSGQAAAARAHLHERPCDSGDGPREELVGKADAFAAHGEGGAFLAIAPGAWEDVHARYVGERLCCRSVAIDDWRRPRGN